MPLDAAVVPFGADQLRFPLAGRAQTRYAQNFVRFYAPQLLPDVNKLVYLDADTIVRGDVCALADAALPDANYPTRILAAARREGADSRPLRYYVNIGRSKTALKQAGRENGWVRGGADTFNAGVLVVHAERWRQVHVTDELEWWMRAAAAAEADGVKLWRLGTQPPLLLVAERFGWQPLDPRWNVWQVGHDRESACFKEHEALGGDPAVLRLCNATAEEFDERTLALMADAQVLHWATQRKPWLPIVRDELRPYWAPHAVNITRACADMRLPCYDQREAYVAEKNVSYCVLHDNDEQARWQAGDRPAR